MTSIVGRIHAEIGGHITAAGGVDEIVRLPAPLLRVFAAAGVTCTAGPGNRLSEEQLEAILDGRDVSQRLDIKIQIDRAGLYPVRK